MQFNAAFPFIAGAVVAMLLYALMGKRVRGRSRIWDVIVFAAVLTGLAISIFLG